VSDLQLPHGQIDGQQRTVFHLGKVIRLDHLVVQAAQFDVPRPVGRRQLLRTPAAHVRKFRDRFQERAALAAAQRLTQQLERVAVAFERRVMLAQGVPRPSHAAQRLGTGQVFERRLQGLVHVDGLAEVAGQEAGRGLAAPSSAVECPHR